MLIGADLASRHGAIVGLDGRVYYVWDDGTGLDSTLEQIYQRAITAANHVPMNATVIIDWDRTITSWGKNANTGTLLTLYVWAFGIMCRLLRKAQVRYVSPAQVRECLGLPDKASKDEVHAKVWSHLPRSLQSLTCHRKKAVREDMRDAWILCFTADCSSKKGQ